MADTEPRHLLFEAARIRAGWTTQQLWVGYLAVGGTGDAFDIEAYLHEFGPLSDDQQDALANAVNERLDDLYRTAHVPYLNTQALEPCHCRDPLTILDNLLRTTPPDEKKDRQRQGAPLFGCAGKGWRSTRSGVPSRERDSLLPVLDAADEHGERMGAFHELT